MNFAKQFFANGAYRTRCPWPWWVAVIDAVILSIAAMVATLAVTAALPPSVAYSLFPGLSRFEYPSAFYVIEWCAGTLAVPWFLVAWLNRRGCLLEVLPLGHGSLNYGKTILLVVAAVALPIGLVAIADAIQPDRDREDIRYFIYFMQSPMAPLVLVLGVVGAPLMEEMLFRGFLQTALSSTRLGFWGASTILSAVWSLVHRYSWNGTLVVFSSGLILSFLLWKTGSLGAGMVAHGLYNLTALTWIAVAYQ